MEINNINIEDSNCFKKIINFNEGYGIIFINKFEDNIYDDINKPILKINVIIDDNHQKIPFILNNNRTVDEILSNYLKTIKKLELIEQNNKIDFIFNGKALYFGDKTPIYYYSHYSFSKIIISWSNKLTFKS